MRRFWVQHQRKSGGAGWRTHIQVQVIDQCFGIDRRGRHIVPVQHDFKLGKVGRHRKRMILLCGMCNRLRHIAAVINDLQCLIHIHAAESIAEIRSWIAQISSAVHQYGFKQITWRILPAIHLFVSLLQQSRSTRHIRTGHTGTGRQAVSIIEDGRHNLYTRCRNLRFQAAILCRPPAAARTEDISILTGIGYHQCILRGLVGTPDSCITLWISTTGKQAIISGGKYVE
ncbi:hypothetical protein D3C72_1170870 [compost metagenome]